MSTENIITAILACVALVSAIATLITSLRKTPHDNRALDGQAALDFEKAAASAAQRSNDMAAKVGELEKRIEQLERQLLTEQARSKKFEDWARRLTEQINALRIPGLTPVPLETNGDAK